MSQENLDLVRSITAAWERGDYSNVEWAHPEIEYLIVDGPSPGTWTGLAGMAHGWRDFLRAWEHEFRCVVEEYRELDDERVLVLQHFSGRGKTSGVEVTQMTGKGATLLHLRDGNVTSLSSASTVSAHSPTWGCRRRTFTPTPDSARFSKARSWS